MLQRELTDQTRMADSLVVDLAASYSEGQVGRGTLDYLRIVSDPEQIASNIAACFPTCATNIWNFRGRPTPWIRWTNSW